MTHSSDRRPPADESGGWLDNTHALRKRAHAAIPGGCHTYAKGDDQYPGLAPGFIQRGDGCHVWDVDGNEYIEYGMGGRAVVLGHAFPPVNEAARRMLEQGTSFTRPHAIEVECAERFLSLIRGADMVKFTKDGSSATSAAIRLARAHTRRDLVAVCSDHPFFSYDDWFIGTTSLNRGVPGAVSELTVSFRYNDIESCRALFAQYPGRIAAVILEPVRTDPPEDDFLHALRDECTRDGAVFVLDEMITGFRYHARGAQALFDITPDLSTFGKGMANGFALSALCGRRELMELGGLRNGGPHVFLLSTTHGAETLALAAATATMEIFEDEPVVRHLEQSGQRLQEGVEKAAQRHGVEEFFATAGYACNLAFIARDATGRPSQGFRSLFMQELARHGVLAPSFVVSYAHTSEDIDATLAAVDESLAVYAKALESGYQCFLVGSPSVEPIRPRAKLTNPVSRLP